MIAQGLNIVASYLEPVGDVTDEFIGVGTFWSISCAPGLALSLVPGSTHLGRDLPPAADVNPVFPTSGNPETAAQPVGEGMLNGDERSKSEAQLCNGGASDGGEWIAFL